MNFRTIRSGATMIVNVDETSSSILFFSDKAVAHNIQRRLKDIDADLEARRLHLYRCAIGDGALGIPD